MFESQRLLARTFKTQISLCYTNMFRVLQKTTAVDRIFKTIVQIVIANDNFT